MLQEKRPATDNLLLDSLEIKNFRPFEHLQIEHLGRVNLIVGKNSVGKSSLLEALWLYANQGSISVIEDILRSHEELFFRVLENPQVENSEGWASSIRFLFFGRKDIKGAVLPDPIQIGPSKVKSNSLTIGLKWYVTETGVNGLSVIRPLDNGNFNGATNLQLGLFTQLGAKDRYLFPLNITQRNYFPPELELLPNVFVPFPGLRESRIESLWSNIVLTDLENEITKALRIISPDVQRTAIVNNFGDSNTGSTSIRVKIQSVDKPIPLASLGDGMNRVFGIALALVNCENGILLVDEIENGLHYTVQLDLWRIIFELAQRLNVQVFATTHSYECIRAFQQAAIEAKQSEGLLIRIENKKGKIVPTLFDERRLTIATQEDIEVR